MSRSILVPYDGSEHAQTALEYALETFPAARLVLFHAIDPFEKRAEDDTQLPPMTAEWLEDREADAAELFADAIDRLDEHSATIETDTSVGEPAQAIVGYAEDADIDAIVIGSRGRSQTPDMRIGSVAELVVKRADVPVTVVR